MNLMGDNTYTINKNTQTLIDDSREVSLEVDTEKTKYMLLSRHQNAGQIYDITIANRSFENVAQFKYVGSTVTNQNLFQEDCKRRLNSSSDCYHSVQKLLFYSLMCKNIKKYIKYNFACGSVWV
jgi:hypothetical protein